MSGGETSKIAELAVRVSSDLFEWFNWEQVNVFDRNFDCVKDATHAPPNKKAKHTHPVDTVFHYVDPYLNRRVFLNTDLKSYARASIKPGPIRAALKSLAQTIDCASVSADWDSRYRVVKDKWEVRGVLFVYNHDTAYDAHFFSHFSSTDTVARKAGKNDEAPVRTEGLPVREQQLIHVVEPLLINYLQTVQVDAKGLAFIDQFPKNDYSFFYPELQLHRLSGKPEERPATIELLAGPYLIIRHGVTRALEKSVGTMKESFPAGYIVYYNRPGDTVSEFVYLLDTLTRWQILNSSSKVRLRLANHATSPNARSNFTAAIDTYVQEWGFDSYARERLDSIDVAILTSQRQAYAVDDIKWSRK